MTLNQDIVNFALVFAAVALGVYLAVATLYKLALERQEERRSSPDEVHRFISPQRLLSLRFSCSLLGGGAMVVLLIVCGVLNPFVYLPVGAFVAWLGAMAPLWVYRWKAHRRREQFEGRLLDLTMGLSNGMRSGLALPQALEATARRIGDPMQEELQTVLREYRLGLELSDALQRLYDWMPCDELHLLVTTIRLTTKSGGSLVEVVQMMVEMISARHDFQERLKNMTAQGRFEAIAMSLAPVAAFILLYIVDSDLMRPMLTTGTGWCGIGIVALLVTCGFWVINKIVTIEV